VKQRVEKSLESFHYGKPVVAEIGASDLYFTSGTYDKLRNDPAALRALLDAIQSEPGVAHVYRAEELEDRPATKSPIRTAQANNFFRARSGDLLIVPRPNWTWDFSTSARPRQYGTTHGTPYYYDQRVPVLFMGFGIQSGEYFQSITPADIAPTLAALCGITLAPRDGRVLAEALNNSSARPIAAKLVRAAPPKQR
jgi:hypothetical protein